MEQVKRQGPFRPRKSKMSLMAEVFGPGGYLSNTWTLSVGKGRNITLLR